ncbi:MAG: methionyl-tRNA formyltransferase [Alphaproteobacteria bacterium]|nr:methionyl-tRNA formyltransferase [Alphaproteobacteria bacterium]
MRLVFMGTPEFAACALRALIAAGHEIACVYTQPPRPAGRGQKEVRSVVHMLADERGLAVRTPVRLRDAADQVAFAALGAEAAVVAAYGLILPKPILEAPRRGCLNIHASLLPRWRGAAPIQRAILAGDPETGITIMQMDAGLDTGPMLLREAIAIAPDMTAGALHDRLAELGGRLIVETLSHLERGALVAVPQSGAGVTYAPKIAKEEARLDWSKPAVELERVVRAFNPWPGAFFEVGGERIRVLAATVVNEGTEPRKGSVPGFSLDDRLLIACGSGALRLLTVQRAGRGAMAAEAFLRGRAVPAGTRLT